MRAEPRPSKSGQTLSCCRPPGQNLPLHSAELGWPLRYTGLTMARQPRAGPASLCHLHGPAPPQLLLRSCSLSGLSLHSQSGAQPSSPIAFTERLPTRQAALSRKARRRRERGGLPSGAAAAKTSLHAPGASTLTQGHMAPPL